MATSSLRPLDARQFDYAAAAHLLNRAGFGGTPEQVRALANMGLRDAVEYIVEYDRIETPPIEADRFDAAIMRPPSQDERNMLRRARRTGDEAAVEAARRERQRRQRADREQMGEVRTWWLRRMIETPRPLEEKLTLFWHGHFATSYRAIEDSWHMFRQNQLFRRHATGSFKDLVHGVVRDPAMLEYLNNDRNRKQAPNENLARELMELFTLGEGNDYTERDIKEGARALTGFSFDDDEFVFRQAWHDEGPKRILGQVGPWDGEDFVEIIFTRPAAAEFICWKLYRFFVDDRPGVPDGDRRGFIVNMARELRRADWELRPVLRMLFMSEHFHDAANVAALIKSPVQLIVQAIRSLRTPVRPLSALLSAADLMGQNLFFPPSVKGWNGGRSWINTATLFVRQNLMVYLLTGQRPDAYEWERDGSTYDARHLLAHLEADDGAADPRAAVTWLLRFCLGREPHPDRVAPLVRFVEDHGGAIDNDMIVALLALITAMPEYQLC